jgi:hypothetical protein
VTTLAFVTFALAFFRAPTLREAVAVITRAVAPVHGYLQLRSSVGTIAGLPPWKFALSFAPVALLLFVEAGGRGRRLTQDLERQPVAVRWGVYYAAVAGILIFGAFGSKQFIYFQF